MSDARRPSKAEVLGAGDVDPAWYPSIAFADADWSWFSGLAARFGIPDTDGKRPLLEQLYGHLVGVNAWLNLTRITGPRDYLKFHLLDSLSLWGDRRIRHLSEGAPCVDLGSGGGYPGLPLALWTPRVPWTLVDSRRRKVAFLAAAAGLTGARVDARHFRGREVARAAPDLHRRCQLVVSRAAGAVDKLLEETAGMLALHGHVIVYKGPNYQQEEHDRAAARAEALGLQFVAVHAVCLEDDDPERLFVCFRRVR